MIYLTGDTHARFSRLIHSKPLRTLTREDTVIICGDFGGIWYADERQARALNRLGRLPFTLVFLDGNHENYDLLETYPTAPWHGGTVQVIRENVLHLMRGEMYEIEGRRFFAMGGAACHDLWNGVLDPEAPDFVERFRYLRSRGAFFRVKGASWWPQEVPSEEELEHGRETLRANNMEADVILTHCAPNAVQQQIKRILQNDTYPENRLTRFLEEVRTQCSYRAWFCGHYHHEMDFDRLHVLYEPIHPLDEYLDS